MSTPRFTDRFPLAAKLFGIGLVALLLTIPLAMQRGLIAERAALRDEVVRDIARSAADAERIVLPVIVVPYTRKWTETTEAVDEKGKRTVHKERSETGTVRLLPDRVVATTRPAIEQKRRGLYQVPTYATTLDVAGRFTLPKEYAGPSREGSLQYGAPILAVGVSDPRGIRNQPVLGWGGVDLPFTPGTANDYTRLGSGISVPVPPARQSDATFDFSFQLVLSGMERISFVPTGHETVVKLSAPWPHPHFFGKFSPASRIGADGFEAEWQTSNFSTDVKEAYHACAGQARCEAFLANEFGVAFIQPANLYQQLERAAKYGFLFIALTFAAFFLFEVLRSLAVHPLQYGLVGLALAMFFLLLTSLAEHIGFVEAYLIASTACVGLITVYLAAVMGLSRAAVIGALLVAIYAVLFVLLRSEDYALLLGSCVLFAVLAGVMVGTRKVDWYRTAGGS